MFARALIPVALPIAAALALLTACDLSQKKPETVATTVATKRVSDSPGAAIDVQAPVPQAANAEGSGSERSVRLYGPGVSRDLQTRI